MMMSNGNKTDKLDARGMNRLQRTGTLPTVWIPDGELRDKRELFRTRMMLTRQRTQIKNRIHATLAKHAIRYEQSSDLFGKSGREFLEKTSGALPEQTRFSLLELLSELDLVSEKIATSKLACRRFSPRARRYGSFVQFPASVSSSRSSSPVK